MATEKQRRLAKEIVDNAGAFHPKTAIEMLTDAGYSMIVARGSALRTMGEEGVIEALATYGFTEENAKVVVAQIMADDEADGNVRLKAADMMFKVKGSYAPEKKDITTKGESIALTAEQIAKINGVALDEAV